jgi:hypothetical protein
MRRHGNHDDFRIARCVSFKLLHVMEDLGRLWFLAVFLISVNGFSQNITSRASGYWDDPQTWDGGVVPTAGSTDVVTILSGHEIAVRSVTSTDETVINNGGRLRVDSAGVLFLQNGSGTDLTIQGEVDVFGILDASDGSLIVSNVVSLTFYNGSTYRHRNTTTEGVLPQALWYPSSTVEILGYTTFAGATAAGNWSQAFGTMVWNTINLQVPFDLVGRLDKLQGDLEILSTGSSYLLLSSLAGSDGLSVGNDLLLEGSASLELTNSASGDFSITTGGDVVINTTGFLSMANRGRGTLRPGGDVHVENGTISESGTATGEFLFSKSR